MNPSTKKVIKRLNILKALRKNIAYVLIFSLLWQNFLWANHGIYTLEEELEGSQIRTYGTGQAGIVEPGTIKEKAVHNMFEDLQLVGNSGIIFKTTPETQKIYNRVYSEEPIYLSGVIETDNPTSMVFSNPGGLILENPDFRRINELTLAAGTMALTNKGMAYGVDKGYLGLFHAALEKENGLNSLVMAGRNIDINKSFLSSSESLTLRTGQHLQGIDYLGKQWIGESFFENEESTFSPNNGILFDQQTTLQSKDILLESLENGASIQARGLMHATKHDITIFARGNVYIDRLVAAKNLHIQTTGKVVFRNQALIGGAVYIHAEGGVCIKQGADILSGGPIHFANKIGKVINKGKMIAQGVITFEGNDVHNNGTLETKEALITKKDFVNGEQGHLKARSLSNPLLCLSHNLGDIEVEDDIKLQSTLSTLKGNIKTHGKFEVGGKELTIQGTLRALKGFILNSLEKLVNKGTLYAFGLGLHGEMKVLENEGKMDLSTAHLQLEKATNQKGGALRTAKHFFLKGEHFYNYGTIFTCGVHQTQLSGTYEDNGTFYAPTLLLLDAKTIKYTDSHKSFLKDGVVRASASFNAGPDVFFTLNGNTRACFLQLSSNSNLMYDGKIRQLSYGGIDFPLLDYFKIFNQTAPSYKEFSDKMEFLPLGQYKIIKDTLKPAGITLQAGENINCTKTIISQDNGSIGVDAKNVYLDKTKVNAGYFDDNNACMKCRAASLNGTTLCSLFGTAVLIASESANLKDSHILGGENASLSSQFVNMNNASVKSSYGSANAHGSKQASLINSSIEGVSSSGLSGGKLSTHGSGITSTKDTAFVEATKSARINQSHISGKKTSTNGAKKLDLSHSTLEGEYNVFMADHIKANSNTLTGASSMQGNKSIDIKGMKSNSTIHVFAPKIGLSNIKAETLNAEGKDLKTEGDIHLTKHLGIKGENVQQCGNTYAGGNSSIIATKTYEDVETTRNEAEKILSLDAQESNGFKGRQKAGEMVELKLKDMNLFALLNQADASNIQAHLKEGNVIIDEDLVIKNTLYLWAHRIENKVKLTANKDFIAHIQTKILNEGLMNIHGKGYLQAETIENYRQIQAAELYVKGQHILSERRVTRYAVAGGYQEILQDEANMEATTGKLIVDAEQSLYGRGAKFKAKGRVTLKSKGTLYLGAQQTSSEVTHASKNSYYHRYNLTNHKVQVESGEKAEIFSDKAMVLEGIDTLGEGEIHVKSNATLAIKAVYDVIQEERKTKSNGGFFGQKKKEKESSSSQVAVRNTFNSNEGAVLEAEDDVHLQALAIDCKKGKAIIQSHQGKVYFENAKSTRTASVEKKGSNLVWQSQEQKGHYDKIVEMCHIRAGDGVQISSAYGVSVDFAGNLDELEKHAQTSWMKELRKDTKTTWNRIEEEHKNWDHKKQGLSGPAAAVIVLAVSVVTAGTGAAIAGLAAASMLGTMASAAFTTIVSKVALSLINNQGNIGKVLNEVVSTDTLKDLAISVATAGITQGITVEAGLAGKTTKLTDHLQKNLISSGTSAGMSMVQGKNVKDVLLQTAKNIALNTSKDIASHEIDTAYKDGDINWALHKLAHGASGALEGELSKGNALSGALGGIASEIMAELKPEKTTDEESTKSIDETNAMNKTQPLTDNSNTSIHEKEDNLKPVIQNDEKNDLDNDNIKSSKDSTKERAHKSMNRGPASVKSTAQSIVKGMKDNIVKEAKNKLTIEVLKGDIIGTEVNNFKPTIEQDTISSLGGVSGIINAAEISAIVCIPTLSGGPFPYAGCVVGGACTLEAASGISFSPTELTIALGVTAGKKVAEVITDKTTEVNQQLENGINQWMGQARGPF